MPPAQPAADRQDFGRGPSASSEALGVRGDSCEYVLQVGFPLSPKEIQESARVSSITEIISS